jgi:glycosyltransferase involved in cell wall biosynthesis
MSEPAASDGRRPTVSVALPTYGRPEFLQDAMESVDAQTYDSVELVVVDDHSPDPVEPHVREFAADASIDVQYVRHEENRGANAARNTAIREATGEYLAFLDDDDRWKPSKLARQMDVFRESDDDVGFVYTGMEYVDDEGRRTSVRLSTTRGDVTTDLFAGAPLNPFSCVVVRADVVEAAGLPDESMPSWQDREWYVRLSEHCRFESIPEPLVVRRVGDYEQIGDDFEAKRDVSYPRFLAKHRSTAAKYDDSYERKLVASLSRTLAKSAMENGHYRDAVTYSAKSIASHPFQSDAYLYLVASLGGDYTFESASTLKRTVDKIR